MGAAALAAAEAEAQRGIPVGEHAMNIHTSTSHDLRTTARPIRRFGELAVNIHTSI
jgi:hypothetical protein